MATISAFGSDDTECRADCGLASRMVVVLQFEGDKIARQRIYWDQASVLVQIGVLDRASLPVTGVEQARKFENPQFSSK